MKRLIFGVFILFSSSVFGQVSKGKNYFSEYPNTEISNGELHMKLYLPDPEKGYYRSTRFDWSGIIAELTYNSHSYFGEWKKTHDPFVHEDITGPVDGYLKPGMGFDEAGAGGKFMRIGIGVLRKPSSTDFNRYSTYEMIDPGKWTVSQGNDWIEFRHDLTTDFGYAYTYLKRIELSKDEPSFIIKRKLINKGIKVIATDQFNHNFFVIDNGITGPDFSFKFPFKLTPVSIEKLRGIAKPDDNQLVFNKKVKRGYVFVEFRDLCKESLCNGFEVINLKTGAGVRTEVNKPLYNFIFWAQKGVFSPENAVFIEVEPQKEFSWESKYTFFSTKQ